LGGTIFGLLADVTHGAVVKSDKIGAWTNHN
jgi:hypothetical protein